MTEKPDNNSAGGPINGDALLAEIRAGSMNSSQQPRENEIVGLVHGGETVVRSKPHEKTIITDPTIRKIVDDIDYYINHCIEGVNSIKSTEDKFDEILSERPYLKEVVMLALTVTIEKIKQDQKGCKSNSPYLMKLNINIKVLETIAEYITKKYFK